MTNQESMAARVALLILGEALSGDEEAAGLLTDLQARIDARAARGRAVIDESGNITISLRPVGMTAAGGAVAR